MEYNHFCCELRGESFMFIGEIIYRLDLKENGLTPEDIIMEYNDNFDHLPHGLISSLPDYNIIDIIKKVEFDKDIPDDTCNVCRIYYESYFKYLILTCIKNMRSNLDEAIEALLILFELKKRQYPDINEYDMIKYLIESLDVLEIYKNLACEEVLSDSDDEEDFDRDMKRHIKLYNQDLVPRCA